MGMGIKADDLAKLCYPQSEKDLITAVDAHKVSRSFGNGLCA